MIRDKFTCTDYFARAINLCKEMLGFRRTIGFDSLLVSAFNSKSIVVLFCMLIGTSPANAQILDAVRGHVKDIKARFSDHQKIEGQVLKVGTIDTKAKGQDLVHNSSGSWTLVRVGQKLYLQSGEDFRSSPGPDYHVYVSNRPAIKDNDQFSIEQVEVSRLAKPNGASYYLLESSDANEVASILIWCKQFKEYIGSADLLPK